MLDAADLTLWLDSHPGAVQIVAHVRSGVGANAGYEVVLKRDGASGRSELRQAGSVVLESDAGVSLGTLAVNRQSADQCGIEVRLYEGERLVLSQRFVCPP